MTEVIAIDGPSASGKGTIAQLVARELGFRYLDSGSLYRLLALSAVRAAITSIDAVELTCVAKALRPHFIDGHIWLDGHDETLAIRSEQTGRLASEIAVHSSVRDVLLELQRGFASPPGLVADGRDMGTVVFPDARLKVFLTASVEARAERRYKQLIENGFSASMPTLLQDLRERDQRDLERAVAPLKPATDAFQLDSSELSVNEVVAQVLRWYREA